MAYCWALILFGLTVNSPSFFGAALLLIFPTPLLFGKSIEYRSLQRRWRHVLPQILGCAWHWIDLVRAFGGTLLLLRAVRAPAIRMNSDDVGAWLLVGLVLSIGVLAQLITCKRTDAFYAPYMFVFGAIAAIFPPVIVALGVPVAIAVACGLRSPAAIFIALPLALGTFSWLAFDLLILAIGSAVCMLPLVSALLFERQLVVIHNAVPPEA